MKRLKPVKFALSAALLVALTTARGGIRGSGHDFSGEIWNPDGEICLPCHAPHNAVSQSAPLWNHEETSATFVLYSSPTLQETPEAPRGPSKVCLSCHDGTVALDSFGGRTGATTIDQDALIGTDLSDDHPISIRWSHQTGIPPGTACLNCHTFSPTTLTTPLKFYNGYVECATCHDPHNGESYPALLRAPIDGSEICQDCHAK